MKRTVFAILLLCLALPLETLAQATAASTTPPSRKTRLALLDFDYGTVDARMVDIDTAEILGVADGKGESSRESTSLLGGGGSWHGFGAGNVDFGSSDFENTIIGEAVKGAVTQLSTGIIANKDKLQARIITVQGLVAAVDGGDIVLNVGAKTGLKVGDQMTVERVSKEIKDPSTGQVIRRVSSKLGVIQVTDVDDGSSVAKVVSGAGFKVGDLVKTTTQ